jgi:hypothetical protein
MKLTWHIVAKDLARLKLPVALWVAFFLGEFAIGVRLLSGPVSTPSTFQDCLASETMLFGLKVALGYLLVAGLVFEDGLIETTAFWPTRPISGARLLGAKLLTCLLIFGVLPILVSLPWWIYCGYGGHEIYQASLESLGFQLIPVAVALTIASLTRSLSGFVGWSLLTATAAVLSAVLVHKTSGTHLFLHGGDIIAGAEADESHLPLLRWMVISGCAVVVVHQFLTRHLARSLVLVACLVALLGVEMTWWPLELKGPTGGSAVAAQLPPLDDRITLTFPETPRLHVEGDSSDKSDGFVYGPLTVENPPADGVLRFDPPTFEWRWPDGSLVQRQGRMFGWMVPSFYQEQRVVPHKMPSEALWKESPIYKNRVRAGKDESYEEMIKSNSTNGHWDYYVEVPRAEGLKMLTVPSSCTVEFQGDILKPKLGAEIPLSRGNAWSENSDGFRIAKSEWNDRAHLYQVVVVEHRAAVGETITNPIGTSSQTGPHRSFVAINRPRGESSWANSNYNSFTVSARIGTVAITWTALSFTGPSNLAFGSPNSGRNGEWTGPSYQDWFTGATLGHIVDTVDGRFSRSVPIEKFTASLDNASPAP